MDAGGNPVAGVVFGANGLLVYGTSGYQFDPQGNAAHLMDDDGLVLAHLAYDAWGQRMSGNNPTPYGYKGQWGYYTDGETGLLLLTHRYLDPAAGRFLTRDPAGCEASVNLYAYVGNNTINESDPSGYQRQYKPPKYAGEYQHCISEGIEKHCKGVGAPNATLYAWIWCIIHGESSWNPEARNPKTGATGCMQIIPKYHDEQCKKAGYPDWQTNPCENIKCGTMLLCNCLRDHKGNIQKCKRLYDAIGREEFNKCMKHQYYSAK
jgi:RHS repeat-associated protein